MMSGTLYPVKMYADVLGAARINGREIALCEYKSPFPRENRLIAVTKGLTTKYTRRGEAMYRRIGEKIAGVAENVRGGMGLLPFLCTSKGYFSLFIATGHEKGNGRAAGDGEGGTEQAIRAVKR